MKPEYIWQSKRDEYQEKKERKSDEKTDGCRLPNRQIKIGSYGIAEAVAE